MALMEVDGLWDWRLCYRSGWRGERRDAEEELIIAVAFWGPDGCLWE